MLGLKWGVPRTAFHVPCKEFNIGSKDEKKGINKSVLKVYNWAGIRFIVNTWPHETLNPFYQLFNYSTA